MVTGAFDTGCDHEAGLISTRSAAGSANVPLVRCPGSLTVRAASPAVDTTFAVVDAVYSRVTPGVNAPNEAAGPSVSASVAGTVPATPPPAARASFALKNWTASAAICGLSVLVSRPLVGTLVAVTRKPLVVNKRSATGCVNVAWPQ